MKCGAEEGAIEKRKLQEADNFSGKFIKERKHRSIEKTKH